MDTFGSLHLGDISSLALEIDDGPREPIEIEDFRFMINGRLVFRAPGRAMLRGDGPLSFSYPTVDPEPISLRIALGRLELSGADGLRRILPVRPRGLRELVRVATLPPPRLDDLEPDDPRAFASFEVEDPQGIAHGGADRWYLSSQYTVERSTIAGEDPFRPAGISRGDSRSLRELLVEAGLSADDFDHIGDVAFSDAIVYLPMRRAGDQPRHLIMGLSTQLTVVGWAELSATTGESACAINPWNGLLYLPGDDDSGRLEAYDVSAFAERLRQPSQWGRRIDVVRTPGSDIRLRTPEGENEGGDVMQGVAFSANGRIYGARSGDGPFVNRISVYSALTGRRFGDERVWNFPGDGDEIEGLEVHPSGVLYVSVNDNDGETPPLSQDDFDLYTFRYRTLDPSEV